MVSYDPSSGASHLDCYSSTGISKIMTDEEKERLIRGASDEAVLLAELSFLMLSRFKKQEKLSQQDFDAMWYAHVNLSMLWQEALSMEDAPANGKLN
jgi:hypothetical protein